MLPDIHTCTHTAIHVWIPSRCNAPPHTSMKDGGDRLDKPHVCKTRQHRKRDSVESITIPNPCPNPGWTILPDHWQVQSNSDPRSPDSEYDHGKMEELIKKFLPPAPLKISTSQRQLGLNNMVQYSQDVWRRGLSYRPYRFRKGKVILDKNKTKTETEERTTYSVSDIGLVYCLPGIPLNGGRGVPQHRTRKFTRTGILPPIKNPENPAAMLKRTDTQEPVVFKQTRSQHNCS